MNEAASAWQALLLSMHHELFSIDGISITVWSMVQLCLLSLLLFICVPHLNAGILKGISSKLPAKPEMRLTVIRITRTILFLLGFWLIFHLIGIDTWVYRQIHGIYAAIQSVVDLKLFKLGNTELTLLTLVYLLVFSFLLVRVSARLHTFVQHRYLVNTKMDAGAQQAIASGVHYGTLFLGFIILLQTAGIDLSAMTVMMGALGIGVSFGLQTITQNLISGLIILFERPIKIGDKVQIGDTTGEVMNISLRATTVLTRDNIAVFVPNSNFITSNVINWSYHGRSVGLKFSISVAADADPEMLQQMLLQVALRNKAVLKEPEPQVSLDELGKDSAKFTVHVWTEEYSLVNETLKSEMNFELAKLLRKPASVVEESGSNLAVTGAVNLVQSSTQVPEQPTAQVPLAQGVKQSAEAPQPYQIPPPAQLPPHSTTK